MQRNLFVLLLLGCILSQNQVECQRRKTSPLSQRMGKASNSEEEDTKPGEEQVGSDDTDQKPASPDLKRDDPGYPSRSPPPPSVDQDIQSQDSQLKAKQQVDQFTSMIPRSLDDRFDISMRL